MDELINLCLTSLIDVLIGVGVERDHAHLVAEMVWNGEVGSSQVTASVLLQSTRGLDSASASLPQLVSLLTQQIATLRGGEFVSSDAIHTSQTLTDLAALAELVRLPATAYNFYEASCHILALFDLPALAITEKLVQLSNPDNIVQFHSAKWRLATERLRHAISHGADWLAAFDSIELALTCHVPFLGLQQQLFDKLQALLQKAKNSPISELIYAFILEAPPGTIDPNMRRQALTALVEDESGPLPQFIEFGMIEAGAAVLVQAISGDLRLDLLPERPTTPAPQIDTHDLRYRDHRLMNAVPAGKSLIADPNRTDALLLDMAHEIGHAVVLQGALGLRQAQYRSAVTYCELMLQYLTDPNPAQTSSGHLEALPELPMSEAAYQIADAQISSAHKAAVERAVWRSWMEGVSMYIELLCDPKDDPNEISIVHEAIRGLVDFSIERRPSETLEKYRERYASEIVTIFEEFMSEAIEKTSSVNHSAYINNQLAERDVYVLGYLLVRSVVSAWEKTLERRIPPSIAVKLLLNATQLGTFEALPELLANIADLTSEAQKRYLQWVDDLANLDSETLEDFFRPVEQSSKRTPVIWRDGKPTIVPTIDDAIREFEYNATESVISEAAKLVGIDQDEDDEGGHKDQIRKLLSLQVEWNTLLPIGSDRSRLIFLQEEERVCLAIRTYGGSLAGPAAQGVEGSETRRYNPRYNIKSMPLDGGRTEADAIRVAFGRAGTGRAYTTRIIDLQGHPKAPADVKGASFVCTFLPTGYAHVLQGQTLIEIQNSHPEFTDLLRSRMFPQFAFASEGETIASLEFLSTRADRAFSRNAIAPTSTHDYLTDLSLEVAFHAAALAFAVRSAKSFRDNYKVAMEKRQSRLILANLLHVTGRGRGLSNSREISQSVFAELFFCTAAFSAVIPYGDKI